MSLLLYKTFPILLEDKFKKEFHKYKYKNKTAVKGKRKSFKGGECNVNASNLVTEFNRISRFFIINNKNKTQLKSFRKIFLTFLDNNFLSYLFFYKIFQWFFYFVKRFYKKIKFNKELIEFFFSQLLLKNISYFFSDSFFKLGNAYEKFLSKYFQAYSLILKGKENVLGQRKVFNFRYNKRKFYHNKNNRKINRRFFNKKNGFNYKSTNVLHDVYLNLFFFRNKKKFKFNLDTFKLRAVRPFFRKKRLWNYRLRFKKRWYNKKYVYKRGYKKINFFYPQTFHNIYQRIGFFYFEKNETKQKKPYSYNLKFLYKTNLNLFFAKVKSNFSLFLKHLYKKNNNEFHHHEKKFLSLLEVQNYQLFLDYFFTRISNHDFVPAKNQV